jgi:hypothetical protein
MVKIKTLTTWTLLAACRRTQLAPKIIRQNADKRHFWSEIMGFSIEKAAKTEKYSGKFFSPTGC